MHGQVLMRLAPFSVSEKQDAQGMLCVEDVDSCVVCFVPQTFVEGIAQPQAAIAYMIADTLNSAALAAMHDASREDEDMHAKATGLLLAIMELQQQRGN